MKSYEFDKNWYLGFLGGVGIYFIPEMIAVFTSDNSLWTLTNLLWFLWFSYLIPTKKQ